MSKPSVAQLRGLKDLIQDAVDATVRTVATAHRRIAHTPFALLARVDAIAEPVRALEGFQDLVTRGVYGSIRVVNRTVGSLATQVLDGVEWTARDPPKWKRGARPRA